MSLRSWFHLPKLWKRTGRPRNPARRTPRVEVLEDRTLLSGTTLLDFANDGARAAGFLATSNDVQLYQVDLDAGDVVTASVSAQSIGSALNSYLRVFNSDVDGKPAQQIAANDDCEGLDSGLSFQATTSGTYFIGISASGNPVYIPTVAPDLNQASILVGATHGLFQLNLTLQPAETAVADPVVASFDVQHDVAVDGDTLTLSYRVENRGGADMASGFSVKFLLSTDNRFTSTTELTPTTAIAPYAALHAGEAATDTATVTLTLPDPLLLGTYYVGMVITPGPAAHPNNLAFNSNAVRGAGWDMVDVLAPYLGGTAPNTLADVHSATDDVYTVTVAQDGLLTVRVQNVSGTRVLTLLKSGTALIQSADATDILRQHVTAGTYDIQVSVLSLAADSFADYRLSTEFTPASDPLANVSLGFNPKTMVRADFNGDGSADLAAAAGNLGVRLGLGDGSFGSPITTTASIKSLFTADFNHDGLADVVSVDNADSVSVRLGLGNGQFGPASVINSTVASPMVAVGDFNNDGKTDLVIGAPGLSGAGRLYVYLGDGLGGFTVVDVNGLPIAGDFAGPLAVGSLNGDSLLDITAASAKVLLGAGGGTFVHTQDRTVNPAILARQIIVADLDDDGNMDLVEVPDHFVHLGGNTLQGFFKVSYGQGDGTFEDPVQVTTADDPVRAVVADFNGDGRWDVAYDSAASVAGILLGRDSGGHGTFAPETRVNLPVKPGSFGPDVFLVTGDFNGDGRVDVAAGNSQAPDISVVNGVGAGTLQVPQLGSQPPLGAGTTALVAGDFNSDARPDLAGANNSNNNLSVVLSLGNGFFQSNGTYPVTAPELLAVGDFNGDGQLDLAAYFGFHGIAFPPGYPGPFGVIRIFLGVGDGTFQNGPTIDVLANDERDGSVSMVAADFNDDDQTDLAINQEVFLSVVTGNVLTFQVQALLPGKAVATGNFNNDDITDLIVDTGAALAILKSNGNGTFTPHSTIATTGMVRVGDFNGDAIADVAVLNSRHVFIFLGNGANGVGDGTFTASQQAPVPLLATAFGYSFAVGDFNDLDGSHSDDLAVSYRLTSGAGGPGGDRVAIFLSNNDGSFTDTLQVLPVSPSPVATVVADFDGDGHLDVATVSSIGNVTVGQITVHLGKGDGTFINATSRAAPTPQAIPKVADLNGDGADDLIVLNQEGDILFRPGVPGEKGSFGAPILVNPNFSARDVTLVADTSGAKTTYRLATVDFNSTQGSIYTFQGGQFVRSTFNTTGTTPSRIASADLDGNPHGDLVTINTETADLSVYHDAGAGFVSIGASLKAGSGPFQLTLADVNGDTYADIVVTNTTSGDVSIFLNDGTGAFGSERRFRAGAGPFDLQTFNTVTSVGSLAATTGLAVGSFDGQGGLDVLTVNSKANTFALLSGHNNGTVANPRTFQAGSNPTVVMSGDFNGDTKLDAAILNEGDGTISIYLGDGDGNFTLRFVAPAGNDPTGFSVGDVAGNGALDLIVGNSFGDVLVLEGNGNGTFQPYQRVDHTVSLAVFHPDGQDAVVLGNQGQDRISVQDAQGGNAPVFDRDNGLLGPNVQTDDVDLDGRPDLIVLNSGGNSVDVYFDVQFDAPGGGVQFAIKQSFAVGTNPSSVLVADINGDTVLDLIVTNAGSNDVSILFGTGDLQPDGSVAGWSTQKGPRIAVGSGPNSIAAQDVVKINAGGQTVSGTDGTPDLIISNQQSNELWMLPGVGNGFFKQSTPLVTPNVSGIILNAGRGTFLVNPTLGAVTFIPDLTAPAAHIDIPGLRALSGTGGDFNSDGATDALVLSDDGTVDLILGNTDGVTIAAALNTALKDTGEIALSQAESGLFSFYVSYINNQNVEAAQQFAFDLRAIDQNVTGAVLDLVPLDDSSLAFIAVLVSANLPETSPTDSVETGVSTSSSNAILGLDASGGGGDTTASASSSTRLEDRLRQGLLYVGERLTNDAAALGKALGLALQEIVSVLDSTLGGADADTAEAQWRSVLGSSLGPLQQVGQRGAQMIGEAIKNLIKSPVSGLGKPTGQPQTWLTPATDGPAADIASLEYALALSILEGNVAGAGPDPPATDADDAVDAAWEPGTFLVDRRIGLLLAPAMVGAYWAVVPSLGAEDERSKRKPLAP